MTRRILSLLLALTMMMGLLTAGAYASADPSGEASPEAASLTLSAEDISVSLVGETVTASLTVPASAVNGSAQTWAESLTWSLTRDTEDSPYVPAEAFPYIYTGDELQNWQTWGTNGTNGEAWFTIEAPVVTEADGTVTVELTFTTGTFQVTEDGQNYSDSFNTYNSQVSILGSYDLSVSGESGIIASAPLEVNLYDSHTPYSELYEELLNIQALAGENGRYFEIVEYGESEGGFTQYYVILSDSEASVEAFRAMNEIAETDPASLQAQIDDGRMNGEDYRIPFLINNVHPNEDPGIDSHVNLLRELATADTLTYYTLTGLADGSEVDMALFDPQVAAIEGFTGLGSRKISGSETNGNNDLVTDAGEYYTISDAISIDVEELLDNLIIIDTLNENPDGRSYNSRTNANGFDLNRDASNQTQAETQNIVQVINEWNPALFVELHGFMEEFLVEPCTPPHEPNMEYDILVENFLRGAEAYGSAALATMSAEGAYTTKFQSYYTPLRDDYDPETMTWSAWDDLCTNYGPSYAMLNCGAMGYTIETPTNNEACTRLLECGMYGLLAYAMEYKDDIYMNQLEFFRRGVENEDHRAEMESWYVDVSNNTLDPDTWRIPYEGNGKYFPEYYIIPVDAAGQRDTADAWAMGEFLTRNGVDVCALTDDVTIDGVTYAAGSLVVNMYQAKRNYANAVLWTGADASNSGFPDLYSESVSNFPEMRGFDCVAIDTVGALEGLLSQPLTSFEGASQLAGEGTAVVLSNNGTEAVRAVNSLLARGYTVGMITAGEYTGDYLMSLAAYEAAAADYVLTATAVNELPEAYAISAPTLYLAGRYDAFSNSAVTEGYYSQWFSQGANYAQFRNIRNNGTSNYDVMAYANQLGFTVTDDAAQADIILGSVALNQGESGDSAVAAVQAGTPYIATGATPLSYIQENLLTDMSFSTLGMEALHTVEYPSASLITASQAADGDNVIYTYRCAVITALPEGAEILIQAAAEDSFLAGCCLNEEGETMDGYTEAFTILRDGMDITVFANSIVNRAHQQDDYTFVTNAIYAKSLSDTPMTLADLG